MNNCCKHCPEDKDALIETLLSNTSFCGLDNADRLLQAERQAEAVRNWIASKLPYCPDQAVDFKNRFLNNLGV